MGLCSFYLCYAQNDDEPFVVKLHRDLTARGLVGSRLDAQAPFGFYSGSPGRPSGL
jgi:hypothetical protein